MEALAGGTSHGTFNIYVSSFQLFNFGLGAAMSVITLILMLIPGFLYLRALRLGEVRAS